MIDITPGTVSFIVIGLIVGILAGIFLHPLALLSILLVPVILVFRKMAKSLDEACKQDKIREEIRRIGRQ